LSAADDMVACPACGCERTAGTPTHAVSAALADGDLDRALTLGLLDVAQCAGCEAACTATLLAARDGRVRALAARERYRVREARLARRSTERGEARTATDTAGSPGTPAPQASMALPPAAAAALARAKAKAVTGR